MSQNQYFRAGAGSVIYNDNGEILLFSRSDRPNIWQLQQGGMDSGENIEQTLWRELLEETAFTRENFYEVAPYPTWLLYQYSVQVRELMSKPDCLGQTHRWYFLKLKTDAKIDITKAADPEFSDWKWSTFAELIAETDTLKKEVYQELGSFFETNIFLANNN